MLELSGIQEHKVEFRYLYFTYMSVFKIRLLQASTYLFPHMKRLSNDNLCSSAFTLFLNLKRVPKLGTLPPISLRGQSSRILEILYNPQDEHMCSSPAALPYLQLVDF